MKTNKINVVLSLNKTKIIDYADASYDIMQANASDIGKACGTGNIDKLRSNYPGACPPISPAQANCCSKRTTI